PRTTKRASGDSTSTKRHGWLYPTDGARHARSTRRSTTPTSSGVVAKRRTSRRHTRSASRVSRNVSSKSGGAATDSIPPSDSGRARYVQGAMRPLIALCVLAGCSGGSHEAAVVAPPAGSTTVTVPASMRSAPFDVARSLKIPGGYHISVYVRIPGARFAVVTPDSSLLVSVPGAGLVKLVRPNPNGDPIVSNFISGLDTPQGLAIHTVGATTYLYVAEATKVDRYVWTAGQPTPGARQVIVSGLLTGGSHPYKDLALDANDMLYVALGSSCNVCTNDLSSSPQRAAIYQYNADGTGGRLFAHGLRNAEGLAILPATNQLWVTV